MRNVFIEAIESLTLCIIMYYIITICIIMYYIITICIINLLSLENILRNSCV